MTTLDSEFEADLRESLLSDAETTLVGQRDNLVFQAIQHSHDRLRSFDYDVESIIDSLGPVQVDRDDRSVTVRYGWDHPAAPYFEYGTSAHTIDGDPVLSFVWENPPEWVKEEFESEGEGWRVFFSSVDHPGGPDETRFTRAGLDWLRRKVT